MTTKPNTTKKVTAVLGPTARILTLADLPDPNTRRWVPRRKAEVVHAVRGNLLTKDEAMKRYNITNDEYSEWESHYKDHGLPGLRVTRVQEYRS
ncbi:MAG: DUF1153 domain-containing protein [Betaproteobacteria bacterium]